MFVISLDTAFNSVVSSVLRIVAIYSSAFHPSCIGALKLNGPVAVVSPLDSLPKLATLVTRAHAYFVASSGSTNLIKLFSVNILKGRTPVNAPDSYTNELSNTSTVLSPDVIVSWKYPVLLVPSTTGKDFHIAFFVAREKRFTSNSSDESLNCS